MEKKLRTVKAIAIILIAILILFVAFGGVYLKKQGMWKNVIKDFSLGMELKGYRELRYVLDDSEEEQEVYVDENGNYKGTVKEDSSSTEETSETTDATAETTETPETADTTVESEDQTQQNDSTDETKTAEVAKEADVEGKYKTEKRTIRKNEQEDINIENFEKAKKIIQKRLETIELNEYNIRQDSVTGEIVVELPDDDNLQLEETLISTVGKLEIIDYQTGVVLLDNSYITNSTMLSSNADNQYQAYLQLEFTDEGKEIVKQISNEYKELTTADGQTETKYIAVNMDGQTLIQTYFQDELSQGILQIPITRATSDYNEFVENVEQVSRISYILNNETMPLVYKLNSDSFIKSSIIDQYMMIAVIVSIVVVAIISLCLIIKYKLKGLYACILDLAYIALLSLIIRYTNVLITLNSLVAFVCVVIINYVFTFKILKEISNKSSKTALLEVMKELYLAIVPVCIIAVIFTFMSSAVISSIGMTLFWGLIVQAICSLIVLV